MGCVVKVLVGYRSAWWRAAGLSGQSVCDAGPVVATYKFFYYFTFIYVLINIQV